MKKIIIFCLIFALSYTNFSYAKVYNFSDILQVKRVKEYENDTTVPLKDLDSVIFGQYPQSDITGVTKEPIEWLVLTIDKDNDKAFLLSKYILTNSPSEEGGYSYYGASYGNSNLRSFMNNNFYNEAFTDEEKKLILDTDIFEGTYPYSYISTDKIFPPTTLELETYLKTEYHVNADCKYYYSIPTPYALTVPRISGNNMLYLEIRNNPNCQDFEKWKNGFGNYVSRVYKIGYIDTSAVPGRIKGIRPAMWVKYK